MMHDCDNADVRDLLPMRLHGTLNALGNARVDAHLAQCASCVEELALLRLVHRALPTPEVAIADVVRVVAAVPTVSAALAWTVPALARRAPVSWASPWLRAVLWAGSLLRIARRSSPARSSAS